MQAPLEYEIGKFIEFNEKAEGQAILDYTDFLKFVAESELSQDDKDYIASVINEIISDELNHQQKLQELYTAITDIKANKD